MSAQAGHCHAFACLPLHPPALQPSLAFSLWPCLLPTLHSLASVLKGRGRAAWDAIAPSLKAALGRMDLATQVCA